jgi:hypothetical protein
VHQAVRAPHGPRHRADPPAAAGIAAARKGRGRGHDGESAEEQAAAAECWFESRVSGLFRRPHLRVQRRRDAADGENVNNAAGVRIDSVSRAKKNEFRRIGWVKLALSFWCGGWSASGWE